MIQLMEKINLKNIDEINIPDAIMIRPKLVAVFDNIKDTINIMTSVYHNKKIKAEEEQEAYQEGKYEKKKYFDEGGVWIPRIVTFLILMLLFWLIGNVETYYDNALFCENGIC